MGFINKLAVMQTNDNQLFLEEFGSIDMNPQYSTDVAKLPLNTAKNRYNNILPYDHSRVKLSSHKHSTDYINANFCSVSTCRGNTVDANLMYVCNTFTMCM